MTWLEDCRPSLNIGGKQADDHWNRLINHLDGQTFVRYVDPEIGKAIITSRPVQANEKDWSAFVEDKKQQRSRIAINLLKNPSIPDPSSLFDLIADPADYDQGGKTDTTKRLRAIAKVMLDELGYINNTWLAQIMEACTGIPHDSNRVKNRIKDMK